jgi:hypothetical protein
LLQATTVAVVVVAGVVVTVLHPFFLLLLLEKRRGPILFPHPLLVLQQQLKFCPDAPAAMFLRTMLLLTTTYSPQPLI